MAFADVTKEYVDLLSYGKYASRTAMTSEFETIKTMQADAYLNPATTAMPDKKYTRGLALLVCHYYAMDDTQSPEAGAPDTEFGNITTERVGDLTQVRGLQPYIGQIEGWKTYFLQSKYGVEFIALLKTFKNNPIVL
ncbi:MAG: DUF4054 domain-containing protein [Betaproteobacteria bacterium]|nr:MAG: DUF4054 domain-containing protein [Betaproteobacteria bacterium]